MRSLSFQLLKSSRRHASYFTRLDLGYRHIPDRLACGEVFVPLTPYDAENLTIMINQTSMNGLYKPYLWSILLSKRNIKALGLKNYSSNIKSAVFIEATQDDSYFLGPVLGDSTYNAIRTTLAAFARISKQKQDTINITTAIARINIAIIKNEDIDPVLPCSKI